MNPAVLGLIRALGTVVVLAVVAFLANAANIAPVFGDSLAVVIASVALAVEHAIEASNGKALFGAVRVRK